MITVTALSTGYYHVRGDGPCNWAQLPHWPADEQTIRAHAFPEASEAFIRAAVAASRRLFDIAAVASKAAEIRARNNSV